MSEKPPIIVYIGMGKAITTLIVLALIVAGGIWMFNRNGNDVAVEDANSSVYDLTGTGGPEGDFDPLDLDRDGDVDQDDEDYEVKG